MIFKCNENKIFYLKFLKKSKATILNSVFLIFFMRVSKAIKKYESTKSHRFRTNKSHNQLSFTILRKVVNVKYSGNNENEKKFDILLFKFNFHKFEFLPLKKKCTEFTL